VSHVTLSKGLFVQHQCNKKETFFLCLAAKCDLKYRPWNNH